MSAQSVLRQRSLVGHLRQRRSETAAVSTPGTPAASRSVHLTGASMRFLEMGLAVASIATALLIGAGR